MKVVIICYKGFGADGISSFILNNYRHFDHRRLKCSLIYPRIIGKEDIAKQYLKEFADNGDATYHISKDCGVLRYFRELSSILTSGKYDVAHIHGSSGSIVLEMMAAKYAGIKKIFPHSHNTTGSHVVIHKLCVPMVNWLSTRRLACGMEAGKWMYGEKAFTIVPNGIDTDCYRFDEDRRVKLRSAMNISDDEMVIGHVGGFNHQKNQQFMVRLAKYIETQNPNLKFRMLLIGRGYMLEQTKALAKELQVCDKVYFLKQRTDVADLLQAMDVFFLPSLFEGFPIVGIEAQTAGLPTLMSSTISKEAELTDLVTWLPIDQGSECWYKALSDLKINSHDRKCYADKVAQKGYRIIETAHELQNIYLNH